MILLSSYKIAMRNICTLSAVSLCCFIVGCGDIFTLRAAPLFKTPITIKGESIGSAIIDTGGRYELMLRDRFGLRIIDSADVLAFNGREQVRLTESFPYEVNGIKSTAVTALVGISVCDCNGLGFFFFRKTGTILGLNFDLHESSFLRSIPEGGVTFPFLPPPPQLSNFDSSFIEVELGHGDTRRTVIAILDTGTTNTVMQFGAITAPADRLTNRVDLTINHPLLGTVSAKVGLYNRPGLPDIIIGNDVMRAWSNRWYFQYLPRSGTITAFPQERAAELPARRFPSADEEPVGIPFFQPLIELGK